MVSVVDETGTRKQIWRSVPSGVDPEQELTRLLRELDEGRLVAESRSITVGDYLDGQWLPHMRTRLRESTWTRYADLIHREVVPVVGDVRLGQLRPPDVQRVVDGMVGRGLAARTSSMDTG